MRGKTYGELDPALRWSCGYMEHATDPACMAPARWHGVIIGSDLAMACCNDHRGVMALSADYVHEMGSACFLPGSVFFWPENFCQLPDELAIEQLAEAVLTTTE